jgi:hypothetical protein
VTSDASILFGQNPVSLEFNARQDLSEDERYTLYTLYERDRSVTLIPVIARFMGRVNAHHLLQRFDEQIKEQRYDYGGNAAYRIIDLPLIKPLLGYAYSQLFTSYYSDLDIRLHTLKARLTTGIPVWKKGRMEVTGEIVDRIYNMENVPLFFSIREPAGLTERLQLTANVGVGAQTVLSLNYSIEFPPDRTLRQNLRLQTKILF